MLKKIFISTLFSLTIAFSFGQTMLKLKKEGGIYLIPCKINGLDFDLFFDTGASLVSLSLKEAKKLIAAGKLDVKDIIGKTQMSIANGQFVNGTIILIRDLKIGDLVLTDVEAVITESQTAPLLLGQSAISRFGEFTFDYATSTLKINKLGKATTPVTVSIPKLSEEFKKKSTPEEIATYELFFKHRAEIVKNFVIEISNYKISTTADGETNVSLSFDITNNSDYDFIDTRRLGGPFVYLKVFLLTEEGKIYVSEVLLYAEIPAHTTSSSTVGTVSIRANKLKGIKFRIDTNK